MGLKKNIKFYNSNIYINKFYVITLITQERAKTGVAYTFGIYDSWIHNSAQNPGPSSPHPFVPIFSSLLSLPLRIPRRPSVLLSLGRSGEGEEVLLGGKISTLVPRSPRCQNT